MKKEIITEFKNRNEFLSFLKYRNYNLLIIKFGAEWSGPCLKINKLINDFYKSCDNNIICADINIDNSFDLYAYLKHKKMISGIPTILCYYPENTSYIPDDSISGTNVKDINDFFDRCLLHVDNIL